MRNFQLLIKRIFDFCVSLILAIILSPFFLLVSLLIKISSEGPVYFKQQRPGLHGEIFEVYKFRTMKPGSEKMITGKEVLLNDNRITTIGKYLRRFKVDELPQIFNVLKGEMSLVGPRPERLASLDAYTDEISKRLDIVPGMTGLAQVSGNIYITLQDRYKYDIYYAENFNIWLDVKIIFRTIGVILFGEDKYINNSLVNIKVAVKENNI
ncbi:sugar transferase [Planococcus citreus]|uniref:Sugar transferase EpsL n=1 Tax=Planococcus citreus TaxID=1373 RepID=A0A497YMF1_9BACL|nr:sugar transferase [Planococcus citreus]RLJ90671.1 sugar transferase EpsL [Planococcus citreus]